ncbi:hypothetical protein FOA52_014644 [Chlamydomonas sp. UWO 241]|nr:hypothetical protein FOA52_014644 [Chlamydomonas sp. UWO 241]
MLSKAGWNVRRHLGTKTRYNWRAPMPGAPSLHDTPDPEGYKPLTLWLLSRHGTRWPTEHRMTHINGLEGLFRDARNTLDHPWIEAWSSPVKDKLLASGDKMLASGVLHSVGEEEMWALGARLRGRFPGIANHHYAPYKFPIVATQVLRTSASATAFASGFFPSVPVGSDYITLASGGGGGWAAAGATAGAAKGAATGVATGGAAGATMGAAAGAATGGAAGGGKLADDGPRRAQAVSVFMRPKTDDPLLRFYDTCPAYAAQLVASKEWMATWMSGLWAQLAPDLERSLGLVRAMQPSEVDALWTLCTLEAGLEDDTSRACSLFDARAVEVMEWVDDVRLLEAHGPAHDINYAIAAPLLADLGDTLSAAAREVVPTVRAQLLFAHAETIVPLATLMGLLSDDDDGDDDGGEGGGSSSRSNQSNSSGSGSDADPASVLDLGQQRMRQRPPKLPFDHSARLFRGTRVSPYGANLIAVLYRATERAAAGDGATQAVQARHRVRLAYNEQVVGVPGCSGSGLDCDLDEFLELYAARSDSAIFERACRTAA